MSPTDRLDPDSRRLIDRLGAVRRNGFKADRPRAEGAITEHLKRLGLKPMEFEWRDDAPQGISRALALRDTVLGMQADGRWVRKMSEVRGKTHGMAWKPMWRYAYSESLLGTWTPIDATSWATIQQGMDVETRETFFRTMQQQRLQATRARNGGIDVPEPPPEFLAKAVAEAIAWNATFADNGDPTADGVARALMPLVDAFMAGVWMYWIVADTVVMVERPLTFTDDRGRFHNPNGPALSWPGSRFQWFFWHGVRVPDQIVTNPETITVQQIEREWNAEVRRVMIDKYGAGRYLMDSGAVEIARDERGILYRKEMIGDEPLVMVRVINSTPEGLWKNGVFEPDLKDGEMWHKEYFLRVPPTTTTARQGVAWLNWIEDPDKYDPAQET